MMNLEQSEAILENTGTAIKKVTLSNKDWRSIAGVIFIACVAMASVIIGAGWIGAKNQLKELNDRDTENASLVAEAKELMAKDIASEKAIVSKELRDDEDKIRQSEIKVRALEDAILEIRVNFKWIRDFMQNDMAKKSRPPVSVDGNIDNLDTNKSLTNK